MEGSLVSRIEQLNGMNFFSIPMTLPPPIVGATPQQNAAALYKAIYNGLDQLVTFTIADKTIFAAILYQYVADQSNANSPQAPLPPLKVPDILPLLPGYEGQEEKPYNPGGFVDETDPPSPIPGFNDGGEDGSSTLPPYMGEEQKPEDLVSLLEPIETIPGKYGEFGSKGKIIPGSYTVQTFKDGSQIHVENPSGKSGNIHYQIISGKDNGKFYYNPTTKVFYTKNKGIYTPVSNHKNKQLLSIPGMVQSLNKAMKMLGEI